MTTTNDSISAAEKTADALHSVIWGEHDRLGGAHVVEHEDTVYIVITGTGDCNGGGFAYEADDVAGWLERHGDGLNAVGDPYEGGAYQSFCDVVDPVDDEDVARAVYAACDVSIFRPGICTPVLTDAQLEAIRDPEAAIERLAAEDARKAVDEGATAPWGDGETIAPGCHDSLFALLGRHYTGEEAATYDTAFRETIDAEAPEA